MAPEGIKSLIGVAGLRAHFDVRFIAQQLHHAFAKQRMIVNDEHPMFLSLSSHHDANGTRQVTVVP